MDWRNRMAPFSGQTIVLLSLTTIANIYFCAKHLSLYFGLNFTKNKAYLVYYSQIIPMDFCGRMEPFSGETIVLLALTTIANIIFLKCVFMKINVCNKYLT